MITPVQGPISAGEIGACAVTTAKINDSAVTAAKIGNCAVITAKISTCTVTTAKIAKSAVTTAKIAGSNITTTLINANAITSSKIAAGNVVSTSIGSSAVTAVKLKASALDYIVYKGRSSDVTLSASGTCSLATPGFTPHGVIGVPLGHTSVAFMGLKTVPATSKATLAFRTATATGYMKATSTTITFYYEYRRP